jgi:S1-C subfamily serine protease
VTKVEVATNADLARLSVDGTAPTVLAFSETLPTAGDRVRAIGFPRGRDVTATEGRLVATEEGSDERFEISAVIEPGNSGGPVLDDRDQVVGVATAIELDSGIGLVIPIARLRDNRRWTPHQLLEPRDCAG